MEDKDIVMMVCGHSANAVDGDGNPCCVVCDCHIVKEIKPSLKGRIAHCSECNNHIESAWNLPFFKYRPDKDEDEFYCGCHGWD